MNKIYFILFFCFLFSCADNELINQEDQINQSFSRPASTPRLRFDSKEELENILTDLKSDDLVTKNLNSYTRSTSDSFLSLYDSIRNRDLAFLTPEQLKEIEEEGLVYVPDDSIIFDAAFASLLNYKREIQINDEVFRYTEEGTYSVNEEYDYLLESLDEETLTKSSRNLDPRITFIQ